MKNKIWYKEPSLILSVFALLISCGFSLNSAVNEHIKKKEEAIQSKQKKLRETMVTLADLRLDDAKDVSSAQSSFNMNVASARNSKRHVLLEEAEILVSNLKGKVSENILINLSGEEVNALRYEKAKQYLESLDLNSSKQKFVIASSLGELYMIPGSDTFDIEKGRKLWKTAISSLDAKRDEFSVQLRCNYRLKNASLEKLNGREDAFLASLKDAQNDIKNLADTNPVKTAYTAWISQLKLPAKPQDAASSDFNVSGVWEISYPEPIYELLHGKLILLPGLPPYVSALLEVSAKGSLVQKVTGQGVLEGTKLRIDWIAGQRVGASNVITGSSYITFSQKYQFGKGDELLVGDKVKTFTLSKLVSNKFKAR